MSVTLNNTGETSYFMSTLPGFRNLGDTFTRKIYLGDTEFSFCKPTDGGVSDRDERKTAIEIQIS